MDVIRFLRFMYMQSRVLSLREIEFLTMLSDRTIRTLVNEVNRKEKELGCQIHLIRTKGYRLIVKDFDLFQQHVLNKNSEHGPSVEYEILMALFENEYVKIDDLCQDFYVSKGSANKSIKRLKRMLKPYRVMISSKPYLGLFLAGDEWAKRELIFNLRLYKNNQIDRRDKIKQVLDHHHFTYNQYILSYYNDMLNIIQLRYHLALDHDYFKEIPSKECIQVSKDLLRIIGLENHEEECDYLCKILSMTIMIPSKCLENKIEEQLDKYNELTIRDYQCDIFYDGPLIKRFIRHLAFLYQRLTHDFQFHNSGFDYFKLENTLAYEIAIDLSNYLFKNVRLTYDEIGMISLYIELMLKANGVGLSEEKNRLALVVPCYDLSSKLFLQTFKTKKSKDIMKLFTFDQIEEIKAYDPEVIFSPEPFELEDYLVVVEPLPIFSVDEDGFEKRMPVLERKASYDDRKYHYGRKKAIERYFSQQLYFSDLSFHTMEEVIEFLNLKYQQLGLCMDFKEEIYKRIELAPIGKRGSIAVMTTLKPNAKASKISYLSLKNPIAFDDLYSGYVILSLVYRNYIEKKEMMILLSTIFKDLNDVIDVYECKQYEPFIDMITT